ncbi:hypothetical protein NPIL_251901 [Nephila pilipes]|uniref:Uncharacterized protein n=1 Tax=Nephila pilipes TaxID=299642 RepID=A0A8X6T6F0_NEPPI|nr:hypothetical protein NPIL_8871 [Nephila pilipes]GFU30632.1 hypothetical protein NPIL_251901 [Nephila pilipes]
MNPLLEQNAALFRTNRSSRPMKHGNNEAVKFVFALKREPGLPVIKECLTEQTEGEDIGHCFRKDIGRILGNKTDG